MLSCMRKHKIPSLSRNYKLIFAFLNMLLSAIINILMEKREIGTTFKKKFHVKKKWKREYLYRNIFLTLQATFQTSITIFLSYFLFQHQFPLLHQFVAMEMIEMAQIHGHRPLSKQLNIFSPIK